VNEVRREINDCQLVKKSNNPYGIEGIGHVQEHRACELLAVISSHSFNEAGEMQRTAMSGTKPEMLVPQQPPLAYFV
jgi:hypothetical protein